MIEKTERTRFPQLSPGFAFASNEHPIEIDGMRVVFDEKVALFPIRPLHAGPRKAKKRSRRVDR